MKYRFALLLLVTFFTPAGAAENQTFPNPALFPLPADYRSNVDFWTRVYGEWEKDEMVIHDSQNMQIVFDVVEIPEDNSLLRIAARAALNERIEKIRSVLRDLHNDPEAAQQSDEHKKIYEMYRNVKHADKFAIASENLRVQQGIKERFHQGLERMTMYIGTIKRVFREEGIPEEIAYLPLVESSFNNQALSKTRAAGIWQFMPGTAKIYMRVNNDVDERLDPVVSARAAASYLKKSYRMFGNWPLALTSYNHGQQGIANAIRSTGSSDFITIVKTYKGKYFKFASRNFYAEFLAAYRVMKEADKYFDSIDYAKPLASDSIKISRPLWISTLVERSSYTREELRTHNPALQSGVIFSRRPIPAGYELRLPAGRHKDLVQFITNLRGRETNKAVVASAPRATSTKTKASSNVSRKTYVVRRGDTLFSISRKFSTRVDVIRRLNGLSHHNIFPGQRLFIAGR